MTLTHVTDGKTTRKDYEVQRLANQHFRKLCADTSRTDLDAEWSAFGEQFGTTKPEMFCHSTRRQRKLAYKALKGSVGRLRVIAGEPLELRRVNLSEFGLSELENDIFTQFEPGLNRMVFDALQAALEGALYWGVLERGREFGRNHLHLLVKPGTCSLRVSNGIIPDEKLLEKVAYLMKPPVWNVGNFVAYVSTKQAYGKRVTARMTSRGLGNARTCKISVQEIEAATGLSLSKPQTTEHIQKRNETVQQTSEFYSESVGEKSTSLLTTYFHSEPVGENASADNHPEPVGCIALPLPGLQDADPKTEVLIHNLKAVWLTGFFNNSPGRIGAGKCKDLGFSLRTYFARTWLSAGEADDLAQLALSLDMERPYVPFDMPETYQQVAA
jgi:hypothetical protein